jgi:Mce-associated membrane protein
VIPDRNSLTAEDTDEVPAQVGKKDGDEAATAGHNQASGDKFAAPARGRTRLPVCVAVLAVLLVTSAGLTAWLYFAEYQPGQQTDQVARQRALDAAKEGTVAALSYSPEHLDQDLTAAKSHLTGSFLEYYTHFTDQVVRPAVGTRRVVVTASVVRAAVSEMRPDSAKVILFVDETSTSSDRPGPSVEASTVLATMQKQDGKWLIAVFNPI